ncbi:terminase small subunit [Lysinibacillus xylanilyticus]|uniref:terminase small subunit n=1 Tax=Lysinibacillus xylanilyticus TaxID=582475 RepID=UPI00083C91C1|nr:terminase small subunit [Lysinibacillus xylanilyticus]
MIEHKLTIKQQNFADFYIELGNATQAYLKACPNVKKESTAKAAASIMLTNVNLKAYIDDRMEELKSERISETPLRNFRSCLAVFSEMGRP